MSRLFAIGTAAAIFIFGASSPTAIAQSSKPASAPADDGATQISCIVYMEYEGPTGEGSDDIASNTDIKASAVALSRKLPGEAPMQKVDHHTSIDAALRSFLEPKADGKRSKCCKRIDILGHGSSLGELEVPRVHPDDAPDRAGIDKIGGSQADDADRAGKYPKQEQTRLLEFIASLNAAACPKPTVHFQACYTIQGGSSGIATEVATFGGMTTTGYKQQVGFPHDDKTGDGDVPVGKGDPEETIPPPVKAEETPPAKEEKKSSSVKKSGDTQPKKKAIRQVKTPSDQQTTKQSKDGMSPDTAQTLGTIVGVGVGIGLGGRHGDDGGRMRDR
jgi:hypothetical protein